MSFLSVREPDLCVLIIRSGILVFCAFVVAKFWFWAPRLGFVVFFVEPNFGISGGVNFDFCGLDFVCLLWPNFGFSEPLAAKFKFFEAKLWFLCLLGFLCVGKPNLVF